MMACLLAKTEAEIRINQRADNKKFEVLWDTLISQMDIHHVRAEAMQEKMDVNLKEIIAEMRAWWKELKFCREAMMEAYLKKMQATDLEANPEETESAVKHQEVPKEEVAEEDWYGTGT
jgi:hypothetical protein